MGLFGSSDEYKELFNRDPYANMFSYQTENVVRAFELAKSEAELKKLRAEYEEAKERKLEERLARLEKAVFGDYDDGK